MELYLGYISKETEENAKEGEKFIDLDGYRTAWLKVSSDPDSSPITSIDFLCVPLEGKDKLVHKISLLL